MTYLPAILSLSKGGPLVFVEPDRSDLVHLLLHGDLKELWIFLKVRKSCISVSLIHLIYVLVIKKPAKQFARQNQFTDFYMLSVFNAVVLPTVTGFIPSSPAPINEHLECLNPFHATDLSIPPWKHQKTSGFLFSVGIYKDQSQFLRLCTSAENKIGPHFYSSRNPAFEYED